MAWVVFKDTRQLELYGGASSQTMRLVRRYPVLAASGALGPKARRGDRQVPEGIYRVVSLNPNSRFHLSLELDYPNAADRARNPADADLGDDIFIHGKAVSAGCLAMGDPVIEQLFVLAADVGRAQIEVVIAPTDLRIKPLPPTLTGRALSALYHTLRLRLLALPTRASWRPVTHGG